MNATELVGELTARGVELQPAGNRLRFRPAGRLTPELEAALRAHKVEILSLLGSPLVGASLGGIEQPDSVSVAEACAMPLEEFAMARLRLAVSSKILGETVVFASDNALIEPGEQRVVYRARELFVLLGLSPDQLRPIHKAKKIFGGSVEPS